MEVPYYYYYYVLAYTANIYVFATHPILIWQQRETVGHHCWMLDAGCLLLNDAQPMIKALALNSKWKWTSEEHIVSHLIIPFANLSLSLSLISKKAPIQNVNVNIGRATKSIQNRPSDALNTKPNMNINTFSARNDSGNIIITTGLFIRGARRSREQPVRIVSGASTNHSHTHTHR